MAMFGNDNRTAVQALEAEIKKLRESNKAGFAQLSEARARYAELEDDVMRLRSELLTAQALAKRARMRQKNSVERANRLKKQLTKKNCQK